MSEEWIYSSVAPLAVTLRPEQVVTSWCLLLLDHSEGGSHFDVLHEIGNPRPQKTRRFVKMVILNKLVVVVVVFMA